MPDVDTSKIVIDDTYSMDEQQTPSMEHSLFAFIVGENGKPTKGTQGWYKISTLIQTLGQVATDAESGALSAQQAAEAAQTACEAALASIGDSDTTGLRGEAITSITNALNSALASIGQSDSAGARGDAISAIATALANALASIGQDDSSGARGSALSSIATALSEALASIGQTDSAGARGEALTSISTALQNALDAIGESDTEGARGNAITAINALLAQCQQYTSAAADSAALAEKYAENPKDTPIEGSGDNAKYSSKHYAEWAKYWFEQAQAAVNLSPGSDTVAGINKNYSSFGNNTDGSVNQQVLTAKFTEIEEAIEAATPVYMTYEETMAILNEEVTV